MHLRNLEYISFPATIVIQHWKSFESILTFDMTGDSAELELVFSDRNQHNQQSRLKQIYWRADP